MSARAVPPAGHADPVDPQQRAVEDGVGLSPATSIASASVGAIAANKFAKRVAIEERQRHFCDDQVWRPSQSLSQRLTSVGGLFNVVPKRRYGLAIKVARIGVAVYNKNRRRDQWTNGRPRGTARGERHRCTSADKCPETR